MRILADIRLLGGGASGIENTPARFSGRFEIDRKNEYLFLQRLSKIAEPIDLKNFRTPKSRVEDSQ